MYYNGSNLTLPLPLPLTLTLSVFKALHLSACGQLCYCWIKVFLLNSCLPPFGIFNEVFPKWSKTLVNSVKSDKSLKYKSGSISEYRLLPVSCWSYGNTMVFNATFSNKYFTNFLLLNSFILWQRLENILIVFRLKNNKQVIIKERDKVRFRFTIIILYLTRG